jgi:hypothetical protein
MATYDVIGTLEGLTESSVTASAAFGTVVIGSLPATSEGRATGITSDSVCRGRLEAYSESDVGLVWTRGVFGDLVGTSQSEVSAFKKIVTATASAQCLAVMSATVSYGHQGLLLCDVARAIYAMWGNDGIIDLRTITIGRERLVEWCNAAMQLIYSQAARLEYFNRDRIDVDVPTSGSVALPASVQRTMGSARIAARSLRPLESKEQVTEFSSIYGGALPLAYYVESLRDTVADSLAMTLYLAPAPSEETTVTLDVTHEPPRWSSADLLVGTVIPLPHKWAETIFMPLVRKWAAGDSRMPKSYRAAQIQEIDAQYNAARQMLGLADIEPRTAKDNKEGGTP